MAGSELIITIFYGLIGITGALALVIFTWGTVEYLTRIGYPGEMRDGGIKIMEWGVGLLITSIILVGVMNLVQHYFL